MLNLKDGTLWQWDLGRKIIITVDKGSTIDRVQFYNGIEDHAREGVVEVDDQGRTLAEIPNGLLQYSNNLSVYLVTTTQFGVKTQEQITLVVNPRAKPEDYIFTDNEVRTYQQFVERLDYLEKNLVTPDKVEEVITETLEAEAEKFLTADTKDNTVTFKSDDSIGTAQAPLVWLPTEVLGNGEKHNVLFNKVSRMFQNIRFIWGLIGTADISAYGDGTIRGAIRTLKELIDTKEIPEDVLRQADVVDNLLSESSNLPLSARMGSELNKNINMRYNLETDNIEIFYNNSWVVWSPAGMQSFDFISDTVSSDWQVTTTNVTYAGGVPGSVTFAATTNNTSVGESTLNCHATCKKTVLIKKNDKLRITCSGSYTGGNQTEVLISTNGSSFTRLALIETDSFTKEIDLTTYAGKQVYIRVAFRAASVKPSKKFTRFIISQ